MRPADVSLWRGPGSLAVERFAHDSVVVADGDEVASGDPLGEVGNSGNSLLPHLDVQAVLSWQVNLLDW